METNNTTDIQIEHLMEKIDDETIRTIANLKNEIEDPDFKESPEAAEIKDIMKSLKNDIIDTLEEYGFNNGNLINTIEQKINDTDTNIRMNATKSREIEFEEKYRTTETEFRASISKIYEEKTRELIKKIQTQVMENYYENAQKVDKKIVDNFNTLNDSSFFELKSSIMTRINSINPDNNYEISQSLDKMIGETMNNLQYEFNNRSNEHTERLGNIYDTKNKIAEQQSLDDLNLRTEEEIEQQKRIDDLASQFK